MDRNDDKIPTTPRSPKIGTSSHFLSRSNRKRSMPAASIISTPPLVLKSRKITHVPCHPVPTLTTLPNVITIKLLLYLDVDTLENLSSSCPYFDQLIKGRFLTSIHFPFTLDFISNVLNADCVEKKPLLKLKCKKSKDMFKVFPDYFSESNSFHKIISNKSCDMKDYLVLSQMSLLSLDKLREVDLVPDSLGYVDIGSLFWLTRGIGYYSSFDARLLRQISRLGSLSNVTRLDVLVDENFYLEQFMTQMPNLMELGLNIITSARLRKRTFLTEYLPRLEAVVAATKAPVLKLTELFEPRHPVKKVLKNSFIEKLIVTGPCNFNIFPVMERLREVMVKVDTTAMNDNSECVYWNSKADDRVLHRAGLCCVNMGAVYENCPNMEKFMGVDVGSVDHKQTFKKWNLEMKKKFYKYYQNQGGSKEFTPWAKTRWFSKRLAVP